MSVVNIISDVVDSMKVYTYSNADQIALANDIGFKMTPNDFANWYVSAPALAVRVNGDEYFGQVTSLAPVQSIVTIMFTEHIAAGNIGSLNMDLNFMHGHPLDVFEQLVEMSQHPDYKLRKFPMIALLQDFEEEGNASQSFNTSFTVIIAVDTRAKFTAAERYDNSFDDKLQPIYERFIKFLELSPDVYWRKANHKKIDRLYWGKSSTMGNESNMSSDFIDAIELQITDLQILKTC